MGVSVGPDWTVWKCQSKHSPPKPVPEGQTTQIILLFLLLGDLNHSIQKAPMIISGSQPFFSIYRIYFFIFFYPRSCPRLAFRKAANSLSDFYFLENVSSSFLQPENWQSVVTPFHKCSHIPVFRGVRQRIPPEIQMWSDIYPGKCHFIDIYSARHFIWTGEECLWYHFPVSQVCVRERRARKAWNGSE